MTTPATEEEVAAVIAKQLREGKPVGMPKTRRAMKTARMEFKAVRMKLRRDDKRANKLTRSMIDKQKG